MYENVDKFLNSVDEHFPFIQLYNNNYNIENDISNNPSNYYNKQPSSITIKNNNQTSNGLFHHDTPFELSFGPN